MQSRCRPPRVVAVEMGHGHLRAAHALARELDVPLLRADQPPLAGPVEAALWRVARALYDGVSRTARAPLLGRLTGPALDTLTAIPEAADDPTAPDFATRLLNRLLALGLGRRLAERAADAPVLTSYFAAAQAAASSAPGVHCVVTDVDLARAWVPVDPASSGIHYLAPAAPAARRLASYGVPASHVHLTGFPLPGELLGGPELPILRRNLADRLARLDAAGTFLGSLPSPRPEAHRPLLVTFVIGGAGAQGGLAEDVIDALAPALRAGRIRLTLAAGTRPALARRFTAHVEARDLHPVAHAPRAPGQVEVLTAGDLATYFDRLHERFGDTDLLWTKPSELTFFAALGLPLLLTPPLGVQEERNRAWLLRHGAALDAPRAVGGRDRLEMWLLDRLRSGVFARVARNGRRLPANGLYRILEHVRAAP